MNNFDSEADWLWDYVNGFRIPSQFGYKITVTAKEVSPSRQDSNWFAGEVISVTNTELSHTVAVCAVGEIRFQYISDLNKANEYTTHNSLWELPADKFADDRAVSKAIDEERLNYVFNNWYECFDELTDEWQECVHHEIQEALDCAVSQLSKHRLVESLLDQADKELWEESEL
jgi:hypothetical protein